LRKGKRQMLTTKLKSRIIEKRKKTDVNY